MSGWEDLVTVACDAAHVEAEAKSDLIVPRTRGMKPFADLAEALRAKAILVPTYTGRTASVVARLRPRRPIIALTHHDYALRQMAIEWGVTAFLIPECDDVDTLLAASRAAARESGLVDEGDRVVITAGTAVNLPGTTDLIKVDVV